MVLPEIDRSDNRRKCVFPANNGLIDVIDKDRRSNLENILALEPLKDVASAKTVLYFHHFFETDNNTDETFKKHLEAAMDILYEDSIETGYFENAIFLAKIGVSLVENSSKLWEKLGYL